MSDLEQVERSLLNTRVSDLHTLAGESTDPLQEILNLSGLPDNVIVDILVQLDKFDLLKICQTDKKINKLCTTEVWKQKTLHDFPIYSSFSDNKLESITDWKKEYLRQFADMAGYLKWMRLKPEIPMNVWTRNNPEIVNTDPLYQDLLDILQSVFQNDDTYEITDFSIVMCRFSPDGKKALMGIDHSHDMALIYFIDIANKRTLCKLDSEVYGYAISDHDGYDVVKWSVNADAFIHVDRERNMSFFELRNSCIQQEIFTIPYKIDLSINRPMGAEYQLSNDGTKIARLFYSHDFFRKKDFRSDSSFKILNETIQTDRTGRKFKCYTISTHKPLGRLFIYDTKDHTDREVPYLGIYDVVVDVYYMMSNKNWFMYIDWNALPINANDNTVVYYGSYDDIQYTSLPTTNGAYYKVSTNGGVRVTQSIAIQNGAIVRSKYR